MTSISSTLKLAAAAITSKLNASNRDAKLEAKLDAQLLLQSVLKVNLAWLIAHEADALPADSHATFTALLNRRLNGEPIAYILGYREFYGLRLKVTPDTLIPRPDTETLVEAALARIPLDLSFRRKSESSDSTTMDSDFRRNDMLKILDLGTGSGAIALAIAKHRPQAHVTALDSAPAALSIAIENAQNLGINNVDFVLSDWFSALKHNNLNQRFDMIVSNPPYIEADDAHLSQGDLRFEPISALASGADGLDDIRYIIQHAPHYLKPRGCLMLEHGYNQAENIAVLFLQSGFNEIGHARDLANIQRVTFGRLSA